MKLKQGHITDIPRSFLDFYRDMKRPLILTDLCDEDAEMLESNGINVKETGRFELQKWCFLYSSIDRNLLLNKDINDSFEFKITVPMPKAGIKTLRLIAVKEET